MHSSLAYLLIEAFVVYLLVLLTHSFRHRFGLALFYALMGGITAVMSWVTDAGVRVEILGLTFMIGSTVFYTSLLLGVFVVYVFDGPRAARVAISTIMGVSILMPLIGWVLNLQMQVDPTLHMTSIPMPSLRINTASVVTTFLDLVFLAIAWEYLGRYPIRLKLLLRSFFTLLGVMLLDVLLFSAGAFAGTPEYFAILQGTLYSRLFICVFASLVLWAYLNWQNSREDVTIESRPVLAIVQQFADVRQELSKAQQEIERRKEAEAKLNAVIGELQAAISEVKTLRGFIPICSGCKKIRDDKGFWQQIEEYISEHSDAKFSHGMCPDCMKKYFPDYKKNDSSL